MWPSLVSLCGAHGRGHTLAVHTLASLCEDTSHCTSARRPPTPHRLPSLPPPPHQSPRSPCPPRVWSVGPTGCTLQHTLRDAHPGCTLPPPPRVWSVGPTGCTLQHTLRDAHPGWIWTLLVGPTGSVLYSGSGRWAYSFGSPGWDSKPGGRGLDGVLAAVSSNPVGRSSLHPERGQSAVPPPLPSDTAAPQAVPPPLPSGDHTIRVWALSSSAALPVLCHVVQGHEDTVCSLVSSRDGAFLYSGSDDRQGGEGSVWVGGRKRLGGVVGPRLHSGVVGPRLHSGVVGTRLHSGVVGTCLHSGVVANRWGTAC